MPQGKVVALMRVLMGLDRLCELGHHRPHRILLVEPLDKQMHPHTRQTGRHLDDLCARGNKPIAFGWPGTAPATIEPPCGPPPIDMTQAHRKRDLPLGDLVEEQPARAGRVLVEQCPQQGLLHLAELAPCIKGWTCICSTITLAWGKGHDFILLKRYFRMKSAHSPLQIHIHFYSQQNQCIRAKTLKSGRKCVKASQTPVFSQVILIPKASRWGQPLRCLFVGSLISTRILCVSATSGV